MAPLLALGEIEGEVTLVRSRAKGKDRRAVEQGRRPRRVEPSRWRTKPSAFFTALARGRREEALCAWISKRRQRASIMHGERHATAVARRAANEQ